MSGKILPSGRTLVQSVIVAVVSGIVIAWAMRRSPTFSGLMGGEKQP